MVRAIARAKKRARIAIILKEFRGLRDIAYIRHGRRVCLLVCIPMAQRQSLDVLVDMTTERHGYGTLYAVLEALSKSHAVHIEMTQHGCFVKSFFPKKAMPSQSLSPCFSKSSVASTRSLVAPGSRVEKQTFLKVFAQQTSNSGRDNLVTNSEGRTFVGSSESINLVDDPEGKNFVDYEGKTSMGNSEGEKLVDHCMGKHLVDSSEGKHLVGNSEGSTSVGDSEGKNMVDSSESNNFMDSSRGNNSVDNLKRKNAVDYSESKSLMDNSEGAYLEDNSESMNLVDNLEGKGIFNISKASSLALESMLDRAVARAFPCYGLTENQDENRDEGEQKDGDATLSVGSTAPI